MTTQALSYAQLGQRLGIAPASARRLVNRRRWPKVRGNDGLALVQVPLEFLLSHEPGPRDSLKDDPCDSLTDSPRDSLRDNPPGSGAETELAQLFTKAQAELVEMSLRLGASQARVEALEEQVARLTQDKQDLATQRDQWMATAQALTRRPWLRWPWSKPL